MKERYTNQENIKNWKQDELEKTRVCVIGNGKLSDFITADLLALGVGDLTRVGYSDFFEFDRINPESRIEQVDIELLNELMTETYIPETDFIIEASNNPRQKILAAKHACKKNINFLSCYASPGNLAFSTAKELEKIVQDCEKYLSDGDIQGDLTSLICSAMVVDELRKRLFSLEYDIKSEEYAYNNINEQNLKGKKVLQVGAGGAGTFSGLALALKNADVTIMDFDRIEEKNLNRQIFFYDSMMEYKADVLVKKLAKYGGRLKARNEKLDENFNPEGFDILLSCVDNFKGRLALNKIAHSYNLPLVNCGISLYEGEAMSYIPGKTACLDCQMMGGLTQETEKEIKRRSCIVQPSLIMPNQIVGALAVNEIIKVFSGEPEIERYGSGEGIFTEKPEINCLETCMHKNGRRT